ncbi:sensitivity to red-light reduced protein [Saitoella coloradoensis]
MEIVPTGELSNTTMPQSEYDRLVESSFFSPGADGPPVLDGGGGRPSPSPFSFSSSSSSNNDNEDQEGDDDVKDLNTLIVDDNQVLLRMMQRILKTRMADLVNSVDLKIADGGFAALCHLEQAPQCPMPFSPGDERFSRNASAAMGESRSSDGSSNGSERSGSMSGMVDTPSTEMETMSPMTESSNPMSHSLSPSSSPVPPPTAAASPNPSHSQSSPAAPGSTLDLILLDIDMPDLSGIEVARHIRAQPRFDTTTIIAVTTSTSNERRKVYGEVGMDACVGKPVRGDVLREVVRRAVTRRRSLVRATSGGSGGNGGHHHGRGGGRWSTVQSPTEEKEDNIGLLGLDRRGSLPELTLSNLESRKNSVHESSGEGSALLRPETTAKAAIELFSLGISKEQMQMQLQGRGGGVNQCELVQRLEAQLKLSNNAGAAVAEKAVEGIEAAADMPHLGRLKKKRSIEVVTQAGA